MELITIQEAKKESDHNNVLCTVLICLGPSKKLPKSPKFRKNIMKNILYENIRYFSWL